jgi:hypothetical protein
MWDAAKHGKPAVFRPKSALSGRDMQIAKYMVAQEIKEVTR